jgi:uncharacterized protein DUF1706
VSASNSALERIETSWNGLSALIASIDSIDARASGSPWAVKDHLVHITAWERSVVALLEGRDWLTEMGVPGVKEDIDTINEAIWKLHRSDSSEHVLSDFRQFHEQLVAALDKVSDADLQSLYDRYQPDGPDERRPVIEWVAGNTYEHYDEHAEWIKDLLAKRS